MTFDDRIERPHGDLEPFEPLPPSSRRPGPAAVALLGVVLVVLIAAGALVGGVVRLPDLGASPTPPAPTAEPTQPPQTSSPPASPTFNRPTPTPGPTFLVYVVVRGDTLLSIASRFDTTARSIGYWNRAAYPSLDPDSPAYDPNRIEVGWTLQILPGVDVDPGSAPTASPAPPTAPPTTIPPAPETIGPGGPALAVTNGPRSSSVVALTFDMGGRLDPALDIMEWLVDRGVPATIFPTGKTATETSTGRAVLRAVADRPDLFALGNHSWDHPDFRNLSAAQMADQLGRTEEAIGGLVGRSTRPWFRPPYGGWNEAVRAGVGTAGWRYLALWDVDTIDWRPTADGGPTADDIVTKVLAQAQGGSIVLMHLGGYNTLAALPRIVTGLRDRGYTLVTLDGLGV